MGLDYRHTCPTIDRCIKDFRASLMVILDDYYDSVEEEVASKSTLLRSCEQDIFDLFSDAYEDIRNTNEGIREEADRQIEAAEEEVQEREEVISDLKKMIARLEEDIRILENQ